MRYPFRFFPFVASVSATALSFVWACGGSDAPIADSDASADSGGSPGADGSTTGDGGPGGDAGTDGAPGPGACGTFNALKNPYFGDLHAHTAYSLDAYSFDTRNTPFDAYAFARGQTLQVAGAGPDGGGPKTTIERPLDFLAVTDHSEWLGASFGCGEGLDGKPFDPASPYLGSATCAEVQSTVPATQAQVFGSMTAIERAVCDGGACAPVVQSAWASIQQAAASAYVPCQFTSFVAFEWTHAVQGATLHKNVVFATDKVPAAPLDSLTYPSAPELWNGLEAQCQASSGCEAMTIPHNSNLSQGAAFDVPSGSEALMAKYQKLVEIFQHKGGSECFYDSTNPVEPECNFEYLGGITEPNDPRSYVRTALKDGISRYATTKTNPLQLGIVGATDDHNGAPGNTREDTFPGHAGRGDDAPGKRIAPTVSGAPGVSVGHNPGGLTGVWAEENTRESIFAALKRRETFATSGTRLLTRFYQTWGDADPCQDPGFPAQVIASGGVPMGGTFSLPSGADAGAGGPRFVAYAWKDKTDLSAIDIIKGWVDAAGAVHESVFRNPLGPASAGAACILWQDKAFTPGPSFYYVRVLEKATPRWSTFDCTARPGINPAECAPGGDLNIQIRERAWTSPIWFLP